jgi:Cu/Ag efflux protein CusF
MKMKRTLIAAAIASALALAPGVQAQVKGGAVAVSVTEAVVKVTKIDRKARTVTVRGPKGNTVTINVPPEAQNFDRVKVGSSFKMRYAESVAVAVGKGKASASEQQSVRVAPKGGTPGGVIVNVKQISGTVEAIDYASREIALKGPGGNILAFRVSDDVQRFNEIAVGDTVGVQYTEALAMEMIVPEAKAKAPAAPKK